MCWRCWRCWTFAVEDAEVLALLNLVEWYTVLPLEREAIRKLDNRPVDSPSDASSRSNRYVTFMVEIKRCKHSLSSTTRTSSAIDLEPKVLDPRSCSTTSANAKALPLGSLVA